MISDAKLLDKLAKNILDQFVSKSSYSLDYLSECLVYDLTQPLEIHLGHCQQEECKVWMGNKENKVANEKNVPTELVYQEYMNGHTVLFALSTSSLIDFQRKLMAKLGMIERRLILPSIFASPPGKGADRHFDRYEVISIQLKGCKNWFFHEPSVVCTLDSYGVGDEANEHLVGYHSSEISAPELTAFQKLSVKPGDILYLPRGYWHATDAVTDSMSLSFALFPMTRADYLVEELSQILVNNSKYREWISSSNKADTDALIKHIFSS